MMREDARYSHINGCKICKIIDNFKNNNLIKPLPPYDEPILISSDFIVLPALGMIAEGYLMIVYKLHEACMGALKSDLWKDLHEIKIQMRKILEPEFGPVVFFEHGSWSELKLAGNSIVHAHMHVSPAPKAFEEAILQDLPMKIVDAQKFCHESYVQGSTYLLFENVDGISFGCNPSAGLPSQFMRRYLAKSMNLDDQWDWKIYPHMQKTISTLNRIKNISYW